MLKTPLLRWRHWLPFVLLLLCTGLKAQPIYNKKNATVTAQTEPYGSKTLRALAYSTDPAGQNKKMRLEMLSENGLPPISFVAKDDNNSDYQFIHNPVTNGFEASQTIFTSADASTAMFSIQEVLKVFKQRFGWIGIDGKGAVPIKWTFRPFEKSRAQFNPDMNEFIISKKIGGKSFCNIDIIAHELTHGIQKFKHGLPVNYEDPAAPDCSEFYSIVEGVPEIFASYMKNKLGGYPTYNWLVAENLSPNVANFQDPKSNGFPDTYFGDNYTNNCLPDDNGFHNCSIVYHCYYLIAAGSGGPKMNDKGVAYNFTGLGVEKAIQLIWDTMSKLTMFSDFKDMRSKMLEAAHEMGHPVGSPEELIIRQAWEAVGLGNKFAVYNSNCNSELGKGVATWYNGVMPVNLRLGTVDASPQSAKVRTLVDCASKPEIATKIYNPEGLADFIDTDDADENYTLNNDITLSNAGTTVHAVITRANEHFKILHQYNGLDGNGAVKALNVLGTPTADFQPGFDADNVQLNFDIDKKTLTADQIVGVYFDGIYHIAKNPPKVQTIDAAAIALAFRDIFSLEVSNELRVANNAEPIWTIGSDAFGGNDYLRSFANPASKGQLMLYNGQGWSGATALQKAGVPLLWYFLISNGTDPVKGFTNELNKIYHILKLDQTQERLAEKIAFNAFKLLPAKPYV